MDTKEFGGKIIHAMNEAWNNGNFEPLEEIEDANAVYHLLAAGQEGHGLESHKEFLTSARNAISELQMEWKFLTGEGNLLALSYKMTGRYIGEIPGFQVPVGKKVSSDTLFLFRLKDGKIVEAWEQGSSTILD